MNNNIVIIGKKGSGKTAFGFACLEQGVGKKYIFRCPNSNILKKLPFEVKNIIHINDLQGLENSVVLIDEADLYFDPTEKKVNQQLRDILQLSRQNNVSFIFVAHTGYFINLSLFNFIDTFIFKELSVGHFERERRFVKQMFERKAQQVKGIDQLYMWSEEHEGFCTFELPSWYNDKISKMYSVKENKKNIWEILKLK